MDTRMVVAVGRSVWVVFVSVWLLWILVGCASGGGGGVQEESTQASSAEPTTGSFLGEVSGQPTFVALVADKPDQQGGDRRQVRVYLCDGQAISEWFEGAVSGDQLDLSADDGAQVSASITPQDVLGSVTLPDGRNLGFELAPASGIGGLYDVNISSGGQVDGTSQRGGRLEGKLVGQQTADGTYSISGTITPPVGSPHNFDISVPRSSAEEGEWRWVVLNNGRVKGAEKSTPTGSSSGFIDPTGDLLG